MNYQFNCNFIHLPIIFFKILITIIILLILMGLFFLQLLNLFKFFYISNKDGQESTNSLTIDSTSKINTSTNQDSSQSVNNYGSTNNNNNNNNNSIGSKYESQNKSEQSKPLSFQNASSKMSSNKNQFNEFKYIYFFSPYSCVS